jgi:hypothetical protein
LCPRFSLIEGELECSSSWHCRKSVISAAIAIHLLSLHRMLRSRHGRIEHAPCSVTFTFGAFQGSLRGCKLPQALRQLLTDNCCGSGHGRGCLTIRP